MLVAQPLAAAHSYRWYSQLPEHGGHSAVELIAGRAVHICAHYLNSAAGKWAHCLSPVWWLSCILQKGSRVSLLCLLSNPNPGGLNASLSLCLTMLVEETALVVNTKHMESDRNWAI